MTEQPTRKALTTFRPFPRVELAAALREARTVAVVERTDEPLAADGPLTREVKAALYDAAAEGVLVPRVLNVAAGLGQHVRHPQPAAHRAGQQRLEDDARGEHEECDSRAAETAPPPP